MAQRQQQVSVNTDTLHTGRLSIQDTQQLMPPGYTSHSNAGDKAADDAPQAYRPGPVPAQENSTAVPLGWR